MNIGAAIFGVFCIVLMVAGGLYIISVNASQPVIKDTYGNTLSATSNTSQSIVNSEATTFATPTILLILIAAVIAVCVILFTFYIVSKGLI